MKRLSLLLFGAIYRIFLVGSLSVDETKPVIERYPADKVAKHLCEFCIPLKKLS